MHSLAAAKANQICWMVLKKRQFARERIHLNIQLGVHCRTRRILQFSPGRDATSTRRLSAAKIGSAADISWPPPPLQKQSVRAAVLRVPKAVAGASRLTRWRWPRSFKPYI